MVSRSPNVRGSAAADRPAIAALKAKLGPIAEMLATAGYHVRRKAAQCPAHDDMHPSASIYVAGDGDERLHCHACGFDEDVIGVALKLGVIRPSDLRWKGGIR